MADEDLQPIHIHNEYLDMENINNPQASIIERLSSKEIMYFSNNCFPSILLVFHSNNNKVRFYFRFDYVY